MARRKKDRTGRQTTADLVRLHLEVACILAAGPVQVAELADRLRVGLRQAYRVLEALAELGLALEQKRDSKEVYWFTRRGELARWLRNVGGSS